MSIFHKIHDALRDKHRDLLCQHLQTLGVSAKMAERGRPEEEWGLDFESSLGLIEIQGRNIDLANVVRKDNQYLIDYLVLHPSATALTMDQKLYLKKGSIEFAIRRYALHLARGRENSALSDRLNADLSLRQDLLRHHFSVSTEASQDIEIAAEPAHKCVRIRVAYRLPSKELFACYDSIARHVREAG